MMDEEKRLRPREETWKAGCFLKTKLLCSLKNSQKKIQTHLYLKVDPTRQDARKSDLNSAIYNFLVPIIIRWYFLPSKRPLGQVCLVTGATRSYHQRCNEAMKTTSMIFELKSPKHQGPGCSSGEPPRPTTIMQMPRKNQSKRKRIFLYMIHLIYNSRQIHLHQKKHPKMNANKQCHYQI